MVHNETSHHLVSWRLQLPLGVTQKVAANTVPPDSDRVRKQSSANSQTKIGRDKEDTALTRPYFNISEVSHSSLKKQQSTIHNPDPC